MQSIGEIYPPTCQTGYQIYRPVNLVTSLAELRFFTTPEHDCSYLDGRQATTLFVDPAADIDTSTYSALSAVGFRRSGKHIYRPYCGSCTACIPVRVKVFDFSRAKKHRRIMRKNTDLVITEHKPLMTEERFELYERYITERHADGDMYPASVDQFQSFLVEGREEASFWEFRTSEKLLAVAVSDRINDGLSAIYTFFDPSESSRSLGVFAILSLIEQCKRVNLPKLYLGYWIKDCQKMSYKTDYQPLEMFMDNQWSASS